MTCTRFTEPASTSARKVFSCIVGVLEQLGLPRDQNTHHFAVSPDEECDQVGNAAAVRDGRNARRFLRFGSMRRLIVRKRLL